MCATHKLFHNFLVVVAGVVGGSGGGGGGGVLVSLDILLSFNFIAISFFGDEEYLLLLFWLLIYHVIFFSFYFSTPLFPSIAFCFVESIRPTLFVVCFRCLGAMLVRRDSLHNDWG